MRSSATGMANVEIAMRVHVTWGRAATRVWTPRVVQVQDEQYIKIHGSDVTLARQFAKEAGLELGEGTTPTLTKCAGFRKVVQIRNEAHASEVAARSAGSLFKRQAARDQKLEATRPKRSKKDVSGMRADPTVFDLTLPLSRGPTTVRCIRPVLSSDALTIRCTKDEVDALFEFILEQGISLSEILEKREWRSSGTHGLWKRGQTFVQMSKLGDRYTRTVEEKGDTEVTVDGTHDDHENSSPTSVAASTLGVDADCAGP